MVSEEGKDGAVCSGEDQFSSFAQSCQTLCDSMDCSTPGLPVHHQLPELAQTHMHQVGDTIQPSRPLSSLSPPALNYNLFFFFFSAALHGLWDLSSLTGDRTHVLGSEYRILTTGLPVEALILTVFRCTVHGH